MRLVVALALFMAALLSLTSTLAVQSAQVTSKHSGVTVTTTGLALLSLAPGTGIGNAAQTAYIGTSGALRLDFSRGKNDAAGYGFVANQAGAAYKDLIKYKGLFTVTNRSAETQCITVYVPTGNSSLSDLEAIHIRLSGEVGDGWRVAGQGGAYESCRPTVTAGAQVSVDFWWRVGSTVASPSFDVWVEGRRKP